MIAINIHILISLSSECYWKRNWKLLEFVWINGNPTSITKYGMNTKISCCTSYASLINLFVSSDQEGGWSVHYFHGSTHKVQREDGAAHSPWIQHPFSLLCSLTLLIWMPHLACLPMVIWHIFRKLHIFLWILILSLDTEEFYFLDWII